MLNNRENRSCGCNNNSNMMKNNFNMPMSANMNSNMNTNMNMNANMSMAEAMNTPLTASFGTKSCQTCCQPGITPDVPTYAFEFTNMAPVQTCPEREITREEMLEQIRCLKFAITDLAEYLDTHENDQKALCLHREYCKELNELTEQYQKVFGPLSIHFPCKKWRWLEEPWPWERGSF